MHCQHAEALQLRPHKGWLTSWGWAHVRLVAGRPGLPRGQRRLAGGITNQFVAGCGDGVRLEHKLQAGAHPGRVGVVVRILQRQRR